MIRPEWAESPCPGCGATGLLITRVIGRWNQEFLMGRSGALIPISAINPHSRVYTVMRQFQFRQDEPGVAILRVVKAQSFGPDDERELQLELDERLGGEVAVHMEFVTEIPLSPAGKFKFVDQRLSLAYPSWSSGGTGTETPVMDGQVTLR